MDYKAIMRADEPDSNGEIIPRDVLEQAVNEWNEKNGQKIEIRHGKYDYTCNSVYAISAEEKIKEEEEIKKSEDLIKKLS